MGVTDAVNAVDVNTGEVMPNPYLNGTDSEARAGTGGPAQKKKAFFDKKTGGILLEDGTKPRQVYDRQARRRYYENGGEWLPVPLSEDEESAGLAATVASGVLMGAGDEFLAAASNPASALRAAVGAEPQDGAYYKELDRARELETRYADENPWTAFGTKIVAGIPTAIATGGAAAGLLGKGATALQTAAPAVSRTLAAGAAPATTTMGRIGQGATGGVAFGAGAGFASGEGDLENRAATAGTGAAFGALVGMSLQSLSPAARWVYNQFKVRPTYWDANTSTLTDQGRQAVIRAGGDPDQISKELADAFAAQMRTAADPKAALATAKTQADLYVPVPLTRGMRTGNPREQILESRARQGSMGDEAFKVIDQADDNIRRSLNENVEGVRLSASAGRPAINPNEGGAAAQAALRQRATRSEAIVDGAYNAARAAGEATIDPKRYNELAGEVVNDLASFAPKAFPNTWREITEALAFDANQNSGRLVSSLFAARARLVGLQTKPDEMAAATAAKRALDRMLSKLRPEDLQGNKDAVKTWQRAIAERARHGRQFESGVVGKVTKTNRMTGELEVAADDVAARIIGSDLTKKGTLLRDMIAIRNRLGKASPAWLDFKQEVVLRILDKSRGPIMSGRGVEAQSGERAFAASQFAETVSKLMRERPGMMRFLFSPKELKVLQRTADLAKMTVAREGGKQLGSGAAWASMIQQTFPGFYRAIRFVGDFPGVKQVIDATRAGSVRAATNPSLPPSPTSYSARQAASSAVSQVQAQAAMDKYAEGTPLEKAAQITTPVPIVGDAMGLAADVEGYSTGRLEPTAGNLGLTAMGILPFVAGASALKGGKGAKAPTWTQQELQPVNTRPGANSQASPDELAKMAIESGEYDLSDMQKEMSLIDEVYNGQHRAKVKTVLELAKDQDARAAAAGATKALRERTDAALDNFVKIGTREALEAIARNSSAAQWYRKSVDKAVEWIGKIHPEVISDKTGASRARFMFALAMTSNGQDVASNAKYAEWVYEQFKKTGKMPEKVPFGGKRQAAMNKAMQMWNNQVTAMGEDKWIKFLAQDHRIGDLKKMGFDVAGENVDEVMPGSVVLGPKVGAGFYSNLMGNFNPLTMDLWFMRTVGRRTGQIQDPLPEATKQEQIKAFRKFLTPARMTKLNPEFTVKPQKELSEDEIIEFAREVNRIDERAGFAKNSKGVRPEVNKKAQRLVEGIDGILDQPGNGMDRRFYRQAYTRVLNNLRKHGIDISMADLQALDWYPEKDLFQIRGVGNKRAESTDYGTEFEKLFLSKQGKGPALPPAP
jgi:hypothetical protein